LNSIRIDGVKSAYGTSEVRDLSTDPINLGTVHIQTADGIFTYKCEFSPSEAYSKVGFNYLNTQSSRNDDWLATMGLDLESLLSTAWDLIPFSFVVDMFLNIGSILQVQNSSEQVDSFNYYRTHQLKGQIDLVCTQVLTVKPGEPVDFHELCNRYGLTRLKKWNSITDKPAELFEHYLFNRRYWLGQRMIFMPYDVFPGYPIFTFFTQAYENGVPTGSLYTKPTTGSLTRAVAWNSKYSYWYPTTGYLENGSRVTYEERLRTHVLEYIDWNNLTREQAQSFFSECLFRCSGLHVQSLGDFLHVNQDLYDSFRGSYPCWQYAYRYPETEVLYDGAGNPVRSFPVDHFILGFKPESQQPLSGSLDSLNYSLPSTVTTRDLVEGVNHVLTVDFDLNTAQFADLGALALSLSKRFR
jgi:hypothetical protein